MEGVFTDSLFEESDFEESDFEDSLLVDSPFADESLFDVVEDESDPLSEDDFEALARWSFL